MADALYAGIDISKGWCDVALEAGDAPARFEQTAQRPGELVQWLRKGSQ